MNKLALAVLASVAAIAATPVSAATLVTPLAGGNSNNGIMFDIESGANALTLQSLGVSVASVGTFTFEIYSTAGGIAGKTTSPGAFTLVGSFAGVVAQPQGTLTMFDFADFGLAANSVLGLYVTIADGDQADAPAGSRISYTNGVAIGDVIASDGDLSIKTGVGKEYPFAFDFNNRNFNGSITYVASAIPEPATWGMMLVGAGMVGGAMRRRRSAVTTRVAFV